MDAETYLSICLGHARTSTPHLDAISTSTNQYNILLSEFPYITVPKFSLPSTKHGVEHFIITECPPIHAHARHLPPYKLALDKAEFDSMEAMRIIRPSFSPWASPLHIVPKASGRWRPCGDHRCLNDATMPARYPVPHTQDFSAHLVGEIFLSKVDLI